MPAQMIPVCSSNVAAVGYDSRSAELFVRFNSGALYAYYGVPWSVYDGLMSAPSKGEFIHDCVRNIYAYQRLQ